MAQCKKEKKKFSQNCKAHGSGATVFAVKCEILSAFLH